MAGLMMSPSRYVAAIVVFLLIFNMYLFNRVIRLHTQNESLEMSLHTSIPAAITSKIQPATVTVTNTVTTTKTVLPEKTADSQNSPNTPNLTSQDDEESGSVIKPLLAHQAAPNFPAKIWHKCGPKGVNEKAQELMDLWLQKNPNFRHELLTDESADQYVRENYAHWPDVLETYNALSVPILKADFLRVLILYADGGIWSDLDVSCEVPVSEWIPEKFTKDTKHPVNVVVGIEFDAWQFSSWTVMVKPHLQHFKAVIEYVVKQLKTQAIENHVSLSDLTKPMIPDVVAVTGPQAITMALLHSVSEETGQDITKEDIKHLKEPKLLGDILVLPQAAFAALQGGLPQDQGPYLVSHHYSGSWKNDAGGEEGVNAPQPQATSASESSEKEESSS
ncbi:glycosyltransferase family 32 protein [Aspergillus stella-maris]|uniref:glycosyltransferase family 32 protein n=1 Tax=Aspergillus stella-maris TaxID=1810926 RepID=UPI003CCD353C